MSLTPPDPAALAQLLREASDSILSMMDWARNIPDQFLDADPQMRRDLVADRTAARETVKRINEALR